MPAARRAEERTLIPMAAFGDQVCRDIAHPGPVQLAGLEIDARQGHRGPPGALQHAVTELDQDFDPFAAGVPERFGGGDCRVRGRRAVTKSVHDAEQGTLTLDADRDRLIATDMLTGAWASRRRPFDRPPSALVTHEPEPISTSR